jgi:O-antigen ligase
MVISMRENALFGTGFESFWMGERLARMWTVDDGAFVGIQSAHNGYLEVFVNIGLAGVSFLAFVLLTGYTRIIRSVQRDPEIHRLSLGFFIVTLVYNFSEAGFRMVTPIWLTFLLALMLSTHHPSSAHRIAMAPRRRRYVNQNGDRTSTVRVNAHAGQL